jgi:FtsZ-binding cell division protein ZapB
MNEKLILLEEKIGVLIDRLESLKRENKLLQDERSGLKNELTEVRQSVSALKRDRSDQTDQFKTRLTSILSRVEELERLSG